MTDGNLVIIRFEFWRIDSAADHILWPVEKREVMAALIAESQSKSGCKLAPSRAAGTLCIIGGARWHVPHKDCFQGTNVYTHFKSG